MTTIQFLKDTLEEINPNLVLCGTNPSVDFIDLTISQFVKLKHKVYEKYKVELRIKHLYICSGLVELAQKIESLSKINVDVTRD